MMTWALAPIFNSRARRTRMRSGVWCAGGGGGARTEAERRARRAAHHEHALPEQLGAGEGHRRVAQQVGPRRGGEHGLAAALGWREAVASQPDAEMVGLQRVRHARVHRIDLAWTRRPAVDEEHAECSLHARLTGPPDARGSRLLQWCRSLVALREEGHHVLRGGDFGRQRSRQRRVVLCQLRQ
jgi:hypothetical protein